MIFSNGLDDKIRDGSKTQTRRLVKPDEFVGSYFVDDKLIRYVGKGPGKEWRLKWEEGREYAIQPKRGVKGDGRFRVTKIRKERVQEITLNDVKTEGVNAYTFARGVLSEEPPDPRWKFIELWNSINKKSGTRWEDNPLVWVLEIEHVGSN